MLNAGQSEFILGNILRNSYWFWIEVANAGSMAVYYVRFISSAFVVEDASSIPAFSRHLGKRTNCLTLTSLTSFRMKPV